MRNKIFTRRLSTAALTAMLTAAMAISVPAAQIPEGSINTRMDASAQENGERPQRPQGENGERPELPEGENGERPQLPEGENGERPELPEGENGERPERPQGENGERPEKMKGLGRGMLNPDAVEKAISAITETDADTAAALTELLDTYRSALDAEKEALDSGETSEDELTSLRDAVKNAAEALRTALEEASIEVEDSFRAGRGRGPKAQDGTCSTERPELNGGKGGKEETDVNASASTDDEAQTSDSEEESSLKGFVKKIEGSLQRGIKNFGDLFTANR